MDTSYRSLRVLYVASDVDYPGTHGGSAHVAGAVASLRRLCRHVYLLAKHTQNQPFYERSGNLTIFRLWIPPLPFVRTFLYSFFSFFFSFFLALFQKIDLVYERGRILGGTASLAAKIFHLRAIYEMIEPYVQLSVLLGTLRQHSFLYSFIRGWHTFICSWVDLVTVTHPSFLREAPQEKAFFIHTGADPQLFSPHISGESVRRQYHLPRGKTFLYVGSFAPWHACDQLLRAFAQIVRKHPSARLMMVGDGEQYDYCVHLAKKLDIHHAVIFTGNVSQENIPRYIAASDICLCLFDRTYLPFRRLDYYYSPIKVHEYKASGKALVASSLGTLRELVPHRKSGLLVNEQQMNAIVHAFQTLLSSPSLRSRMGTFNRRDVLRLYNWDTQTLRILHQLYSKDL